MLEKEHFDIHDLIKWVDTQAVKCGKEDYKVIYQKFSRLLERLKEDRRRIFDERSMLEREPEMEIPNPPTAQRFKHKVKNFINIETYKELLRKQE